MIIHLRREKVSCERWKGKRFFFKKKKENLLSLYMDGAATDLRAESQTRTEQRRGMLPWRSKFYPLMHEDKGIRPGSCKSGDCFCLAPGTPCR